VYLIGAHLIGVHLIGVHRTDVHLTEEVNTTGRAHNPEQVDAIMKPSIIAFTSNFDRAKHGQNSQFVRVQSLLR
jgi:hypothetical protein